MDFLKVISFEESKKILREHMKEVFCKTIIQKSIRDSLGYALAYDIISHEDIPFYKKSLVDGYAVHSSSTFGASESIPTILNILEEIPMGRVPDHAITDDECSKISTGGMIPEGADAVIPIEICDEINENQIAVLSPISHLTNVNDIGDDIKKGQQYYFKNTLITPLVIAAAANLGINSLHVYKKPTVRIISTGDEIIDINESLSHGKTRDINSFYLDAICRGNGLNVLETKHIPDDNIALSEELEKNDVDLIIISGSSSKGDKDFVPKILNSSKNLNLIFHGINIKPGKPTSFGMGKGTIILGLPGHPVSAMTIMMTVFFPALYSIYNTAYDNIVSCQLMSHVSANSGRTTIQYVRVEIEDGECKCYPIYGSSGNISTIIKSDGFLIIDAHKEGILKDTLVNVRLLNKCGV